MISNETKVENILVSVLVLSYHNGDYLYQTIDSVLAQDFPEIELVISNDGEEDFNKEAVKEYITKRMNSNIKNIIVNKNDKNLGTVKNLNRAIGLSKGVYICCIAGDDTYYDSKSIQNLYDGITNEANKICVGMCCQCDDVMEQCEDSRTEATNVLLPTFYSKQLLEQTKLLRRIGIFPLAIQATMFNRAFFDEYGLFDEHYNLIEDLSMLSMILKKRVKVNTINIFVTKHRKFTGVSKREIGVSVKKLPYYEDLFRYASDELYSNRTVYGKIYSKMRLGTAKLRLELVRCSSKGKLRISYIYLKHLDCCVLYVFYRTLNVYLQRKTIKEVNK